MAGVGAQCARVARETPRVAIAQQPIRDLSYDVEHPPHEKANSSNKIFKKTFTGPIKGCHGARHGEAAPCLAGLP